MIRNNKFNCPASQRTPKALVVSRIPDGWCTLIFRPLVPNRARSEKKIVWASLRGDSNALILRASDQRQGKFGGKMNDMNLCVKFSRKANHHFDRIRFRFGR